MYILIYVCTPVIIIYSSKRFQMVFIWMSIMFTMEEKNCCYEPLAHTQKQELKKNVRKRWEKLDGIEMKKVLPTFYAYL